MVDYYKHKMSGSEEEPESHTQPGMTKAELRRVKISLNHHYFAELWEKNWTMGDFVFLFVFPLWNHYFSIFWVANNIYGD